jgi:photosystem II stability/assembly factor-like uncharacterized protein
VTTSIATPPNAADYALYVSSTSGANWSAVTVPASTGGVFSVALSADGSKVWIATGAAGILQSLDGGTTWTPTSAPASSWASISASADGSSLIAAETSGGLYRSDNGGANWVQVSGPAIGETWGVPIAGSANLQTALAFGTWTGAPLQQDNLYRIAESTTPGTSGSLSGAQYDTVALQYVGANTFIVLDSAGTLMVK